MTDAAPPPPTHPPLRRAGDQALRRLAMVAALVASAVYLTYRGLFTLNLDGWFAGCFSVTLFAAEVYGVALMALYFFQIWDLRDPEPVPAMPGRTVDIFIPTYNEDPDLLRGTITAALAVSYPHRTYCLDDGDRPEVRELCAELGCEYVRRDDNLHAKAGNINHAMELTEGEFVIILDADHVAESHFIDAVLGHFADDDLAFVQTPHAFYNYDNFQGVLNYRKGIYWEEGQLFYNCTQPGKNRWNAVSFCGSAAMFRRAALETVGLIATESITEDLHTGLRLHSKGWKSLFVNERLISGQAAPDISTFHSQRLRWGEGNLGVMFFDNPATMPGLTLAQRLCYLGSMLCWTTGVQKLILYTAPILMLATGVAPVASLSWHLVAVTLSYLLCVWGGVKLASGGYGRLIAIEMTAMACYWTQVKSCWRATFGRAAAKFVVTNKRGGQSDSTLRELKPQLLLVAAGAAAVAWAGAKIVCGVSGDVTGFAIGAALIGVQNLFALEVVRRALKTGDRRFSWRHPVAAHLSWAVKCGDEVVTGVGVTRDLNERGVGFLAFDDLPDAVAAGDRGNRPAAQPGTPVAVKITAAGRTIEALGTVRAVRGIADSRGTKGRARAVRYGVRFEDDSLSTASLDAVWDVAAKYGVARQYERFQTGRGFAGGPCLPPTDEEAVVNVPCELRFLPPVEGADGAEKIGRDPSRFLKTGSLAPLPGGVTAERCVTETLGPDTVGVLLTAPREVGTLAECALATPGGNVQTWASVEGVAPVRVGGRALFAHRLAFRRFAGQGRGVIRGVVHRRDTAELRDAVRLVPEKIRPPVMRPLAAAGGSAVLAASLLLGAGLFAFRDDLLMTRVAEAGAADADQRLRLADLADEMRAAGEFDEARLLRLRGAFTALGEVREVAGLNELLVAHSPETPDGRFRKAESLMALGRHREAGPIFEGLMADLTVFPLDWTREECAVAAARCAANLGDYGLAADRFGRYVAIGGAVDPVRTEWAGLLARTGQHGKAVRVLTGGRTKLREMPLDRRRLLAPLHLAAGDTAAAADAYRSILADVPDDAEAALGLARVALDAGEAGATEAFRVFLAEHPGDPAARLGLARALAADGNPAAAEAALRELLLEDLDHPEVWPAYLALLTDPANSAAPAADGGAGENGVTVGPSQRAVVHAVARRAVADAAADGIGGGGLLEDPGPLLLQLIATVRATGDDALLDPLRRRFADLPTRSAVDRLRRAEVLADLGRVAEADAALDALTDELAADPAALPAAADRLAVRLAAARAAARAGRFAVADERYEAALAAGAPAADLRAERAGVLANLDRPADALAVLTADLGPAGETGGDQDAGDEADRGAGEEFAPPLSTDERVQLAGLRAAVGDVAAAADALAAVVAEQPSHRPAALLLADLSADLDRHADAARLYADAIALDPAADAAAGDRAAIARGRALLALGRAADAEAAFAALLAADADRPGLWDAYLSSLAALRTAAVAGGAESPMTAERRAAVAAILTRREARGGDVDFLLQLIGAAGPAGLDADRDAVRAEFVALPAGDPTHRLRRAEALTDLGRHAEAAVELDGLLAAVAADPAALPDAADRAGLRVAAARSSARRGRWEEAAGRFAAALAAGHDPADVRGERAGVLAELGRYEAALAALAEGPGVPLTRAERAQRGGLLAAAGDYDAAAAVLAGLLTEDLADRSVVRLAADVNAARGQHAAAAGLYDRIVALDPAADAAGGDAARVAAAGQRVAAGDPVPAEAALRGLIAADLAAAGDGRPALWDGYLDAVAALPIAGEAGLLSGAGATGRADVLAAIHAGRAARAGDGAFLLRLAAAARPLADGDPDRWDDRLRAVRAEFVALPAAGPADRLRRAGVLADLGRHAEADAEFDRLVAEVAADPAALPDAADRRALFAAAARTAARDGRFDAAAERFAAALDADIPAADVRAEYAGVLAELGRPGAGAAVLETASDVPLGRDERRQLGGLLAAAGEHDRAAGVLEKLLREDPADRAVTRLLADVTVAGGRFREAARLYARVVELDPAADAADGHAARLAAAYALADAGLPARAEAELRGLLADDPDRPVLWPAYLAALSGAAESGSLVPGDPQRAVVAAIAARRADFPAVDADGDDGGGPADRGAFLLQLIDAGRRLAAAAGPGGFGARAVDVDRLREEFVALPAGSPTDRLRRAEALTDLARHAEADAELVAVWDALARDPAALPDPADRARAAVAAARSAARLGRYDEAARRFAAAAAAGADPDDFRSERAGVLYELGRPADGAAVLLAGLGGGVPDPFAPMDAQAHARRRARPLSRDERVQLAGLHAAAGRLARAADVLDGLVAETPDDRAVTLLLADVNAGLDRFREAARLYERAARLDPAADAADGDRARVAAAYARGWGGDATGAERAFRGLLAEDFARTDLWTPYLEAAGMLPELPAAGRPLVDALWRYRGRMAGDDRFLLTLAAAVHRTGDPARTGELLARLTHGPEADPDLLRWLAASLDAQGRFDEAAAVYRRLLTLPDGVAGDSRESATPASLPPSERPPVPFRPTARSADGEPGGAAAGRRAAALWPVARW